ncbi:hypothetical protein EGH82_12840 [Vibrio ponticus]|uniref:Uncharacterized protein n=2 Tax=Vibrio ponticus TaxID=265668 RepID=A0A3N3DYT4_9VIBR|nr:hypothetical protein EGH82_12840 [Vibrio ponticus]
MSGNCMGSAMSAIKKEQLGNYYRILYFDGEKIAELKVSAESRKEAIEILKQYGYTASDIFSIFP